MILNVNGIEVVTIKGELLTDYCFSGEVGLG